MSRVFISYRHVAPDERLAHDLRDLLTQSGHEVFIDTAIGLGEDWVQAIERSLGNAEAFIVLLSANSILSDMVRKEICYAHELSIRPESPLKILPIRVDFTGPLPYDLGAYLDRLQYTLWTPEADTKELARRTSEAIARPAEVAGVRAMPVSFENTRELHAATDQRGAPLPAADPRLAATLEEGALSLESKFYVRRESDADAESCVNEAAATVIVRAPRQMGKSSLLSRMHAQALQLGRRSCYIDFQLIDARHLENLDALFKHLARRLHREFKTEVRPDTVWDDAEGPIGNFSNFLEDALLEEAEAQVQIVFDEAERVFGYPGYRNDFFAAVRGWHNLRATNPRFKHLALAIGHSTSATLFIQDLTQSPFNVGQRIALRSFAAEQVSQLNERHGRPLKTDAEIQLLTEFLGGHPYLTRLALFNMASRGWSMATVQAEAQNEAGAFTDHLRGLMWELSKLPDLKESLRQLARDHGVGDDTHFQRLWALGLIRGNSLAEAEFRCQLYADYFRRHL